MDIYTALVLLIIYFVDERSAAAINSNPVTCQPGLYRRTENGPYQAETVSTLPNPPRRNEEAEDSNVVTIVLSVLAVIFLLLCILLIVLWKYCGWTWDRFKETVLRRKGTRLISGSKLPPLEMENPQRLEEVHNTPVLTRRTSTFKDEFAKATRMKFPEEETAEATDDFYYATDSNWSSGQEPFQTSLMAFLQDESNTSFLNPPDDYEVTSKSTGSLCPPDSYHDGRRVSKTASIGKRSRSPSPAGRPKVPSKVCLPPNINCNDEKSDCNSYQLDTHQPSTSQKLNADVKIGSTESPSDEKVSSTESPSDEKISSTENPSDEKISSTESPSDEKISSTESPSDEKISSTESPSDERNKSMELPANVKLSSSESWTDLKFNSLENMNSKNVKLNSTETANNSNVNTEQTSNDAKPISTDLPTIEVAHQSTQDTIDKQSDFPNVENKDNQDSKLGENETTEN